ncbi:hypothetical protein ACFO4E_01940 [Nocardiopsis mangrovi]|uniref:Uncharacterized protein n=1 Tax=Nocardiopsis mangrovi TaxID=1179818 RepID=A0ABV9DRJ7_9ACTN
MRRPNFLRPSGNAAAGAPPAGQSAGGPAPAGGPADPAGGVERERAESRRALAREHGWTYTEQHQRAINGWPRTALPPGPLGRVRNEVTGRHRGRPFRMFDYVRGEESGDAPATTLVVYAIGLPVRVPYLYVQDRAGGARDLYAECPDRRFAVELLTDGVREDMRRFAFTDLVLDGDVLICTGDRGAPREGEPFLDALADVVAQVPADVWSRWGRPKTR